MIPVILLLEFLAGRLVAHFLRLGQPSQTVIHVSMYLFLGDTAYLHIAIVHRYVHEVVQVAEHAHLSELGHSGQQGETDGSVHGLQYAIEGFQHVPQSVLQLLIVQGL